MDITPRSAFLLALFGTAEPPRTSSSPVIACVFPSHDIDQTISHYFPDFRRCYERSRRLRPDLQGSLTLRFSIRDGEAQDATIKDSDLDNPQLNRCILETMWLLQFPLLEQPESTTFVVSIPLYFSPTERYPPDEEVR